MPALTNTERVATFQASLNLVRQEASTQLSSNENNAWHPMYLMIYMKEGAVIKMTLIPQLSMRYWD